MTEKQKMLMGIIYNAEETSLIEERNRAKSLTKQYNESRQEDQIDVHQYTIRRNAVLPSVPEQLHIVKHTDQGRGNVAYKLRRAVGAGLQQRLAVKLCFPQAQKAGIGPAEINHRHDAADALANGCGRCRPLQPQGEHRNQQGV